MPATMTDRDLQKVHIEGKYCSYNVYVQGDLEDRHGKDFILTVHDIGTNHMPFAEFVTHPSMADVTQKVIFLHVCVPGQERGAPDYTEEYPTLAELGDDLVCALDKLEVRTCIAFGEGAGAIIICRFAAAWPARIMGMILLRCTSLMMSVRDNYRDIDLSMQMQKGVMSQGAWEFFSRHKFGQGAEQNITHFNEIKNSLNMKNLSEFLFSLSECNDFSIVLGWKLCRIETLLVTGSLAPHVDAARYTYNCMSRLKSTLFEVENVSDVLREAPDQLAHSLLLLCKRCGVLSDVPIPGPAMAIDPLAVGTDDDAPEEVHYQYSMAPKNRFTVRMEDGVRMKFARVQRPGGTLIENIPLGNECVTCSGKSVLSAHSFDQGCRFYDGRFCGPCKLLALFGTVVGLWQHKMDAASCAFRIDEELNLLADYQNPFKKVSFEEIRYAQLDEDFKNYLYWNHGY